MMFNKILYSAFIFLFSFTVQSGFANNKICLILDKGGKDDKSFNQSAYEGFLKAKKELKVNKDSKYVTVNNDAQAPQFIRSLSNGECELIIAIGFSNSEEVGKIAKKFPKQKYLLIDSSIKEDNIRSISFNEHEGSFLVGAIAAMKTKTKQIGFVGGMQIPLIKRFALGFSEGAKHINPKIKITETYVGVSPSAWNNPTKAKELALSMFNKGTDIIFVAAGSSSLGVFDAVKEESQKNKFVIGVDSNQNHLVPGLVLTSMEKLVGNEVFKTINDVIENKFKSGIFHKGFAENAINWSYDKYNKNLFSNEEIKKINEIKNGIINKKISVLDFYKVGN